MRRQGRFARAPDGGQRLENRFDLTSNEQTRSFTRRNHEDGLSKTEEHRPLRQHVEPELSERRRFLSLFVPRRESQRMWSNSRRDGKLTAQTENVQTTQSRESLKRQVQGVKRVNVQEDECVRRQLSMIHWYIQNPATHMIHNYSGALTSRCRRGGNWRNKLWLYQGASWGWSRVGRSHVTLYRHHRGG